MKNEALQRLKDPKYYLENFCKIKGKKPGLIPFKLNAAQLDLFNTIRKNPRVMILKARQIGFSTAVTGYFYHDTITNPGTNTALIGYNADLTAEFLDKVKTFYNSTPAALRPTLHYNSKWEISFPKINSKIMVLPSTENVGRGYTLNNCLCKDTFVMMQDSAVKKISDINVGDSVINGNGGYSTVIGVKGKKNDKPMLSINAYGSAPLKLTDDHMVLKRVPNNQSGEWVKARDLKVSDYLAFPYSQCRNRRNSFKLPIFDNFRAKWRRENTPTVNQGGGHWRRGKKYYWNKIKSIKTIDYDDYVYDIALDGEPHSFLTVSGVVHNCLCSELAFWENQEDKMMTLEASVPIDGKLVIESTPNSMANLYHRMWMADDNGYAKKKYGWWWMYDEEEIESIRTRMNNPMRFAQEYGCEFLSSGRPVFDQEKIGAALNHVLEIGDKVKLSEQFNDSLQFTVQKIDGLTVYKPPVKDSVYCAGIDTSEGVQGGDYSAVIFWDRRTGEEVAMFHGLLPPDVLADKFNKWGRFYNNALAVVEVNNHGLVAITRLRQLVYPSLYFRQQKLENIGVTSSDKIGWKTSVVTRPLLIDDFAEAIREKSLKIRSRELLNEMMVFNYGTNGRPEAAEGYHDDLIMAAGIGLQGFKSVANKEDVGQLDYREHLPVNFAY